MAKERFTAEELYDMYLVFYFDHLESNPQLKKTPGTSTPVSLEVFEWVMNKKSSKEKDELVRQWEHGYQAWLEAMGIEIEFADQSFGADKGRLKKEHIKIVAKYENCLLKPTQ